MKQIIFLVSAILIGLSLSGCYSSRLGSYQEDKKYDLLSDAIKQKQQEANELVEQLFDSTMDRAEIKVQLFGIKKQISDLTKSKDDIFLGYVTSEKIPDELTSCETEARRRTNIAKREALLLEKIEHNISANVASSGYSSGYKVILDNEYSVSITFVVNSLNGGENTAFNLRPNEKIYVYLLSGVFQVSFWIGGTQIGYPERMTIDGQKRVYKGEECFNFAYMPSRF